jgi:beta-galactosidase
MTARSLTDRLGGLALGGDYDPEQWDEAVWKEDDELMRRARVSLATVGVFSWALLEPEEGRCDFAWLDAHLDRLHANGVAVDLAAPTASPPSWFTLAHPDTIPVTEDGIRHIHGRRDTHCLAAPAYRNAARRIAGKLAERYGAHPALALWHVHNHRRHPRTERRMGLPAAGGLPRRGGLHHGQRPPRPHPPVRAAPGPAARGPCPGP